LGDVVDFVSAFDKNLLSKLTQVQRNPDNTPAQLTIVGSSFVSTSCRGNFTLTIGNTVVAPVNGWSGPSTCTPTQAMVQLRSMLVALGVDSLVSVSDSKGNSSIFNPVLPLQMVTAPGISIALLQITVNDSSPIFGFGNVSSSAQMVPTFSDVGGFVEKVVEALGIPSDIIACTYNTTVGTLTFRMKFGHTWDVVADQMSLGFDLSPFAAAQVDGTINIPASASFDLVFGADLRPAAPSLFSICRYSSADNIGILDDATLNITTDAISTKVKILDVLLDDPQAMIDKIIAALPPSLAAKLIFGVVNATTVGQMGFWIGTTNTSGIRTFLISPWNNDFGGMQLGCNASRPATAPTYAPYVKDTHLAGTFFSLLLTIGGLVSNSSTV
jgi:hypothetical protein